MEDFHVDLARIAFNAGDDLGLVLAGGYAIRAHKLTERSSSDLDFATAAALPLNVISERLADVYRRAGYHVSLIEGTSRMARLAVGDGNLVCEIDLLKEAIGPPVTLAIGPVLTMDDAVGLKMRALHDRAAHRDFIDVRAAATIAGYGFEDLERLARRHTPWFSPQDLADRLESAEMRDDRTFHFYGLEDHDVAALRQWAQSWADDIRSRVAAAEVVPSEPDGAEPDWDTYLE